MLSTFIDTQLAQIDNLDELKVTLVVLRLLAKKQTELAMVTAEEVLAHPAVREGLRMPAIQLTPALQLAVARGTLLESAISGVTRYLLNTPHNQLAVEALAGAARERNAPEPDVAAMLKRVGREIARLEHIDVYPPAADDMQQMEDWLARGYIERELIAAVQNSLLHPRARHMPHRTLAHIAKALTKTPPETPTEYFDVIIARKRPAPEEIVNLRLRLGHEPNSREYSAVRSAVALFGLRATLEALGRLTHDGVIDIDALMALLGESESAALATAHAQVNHDEALRDAIRLYESSFGTPPTSLIANEIKLVLAEVKDTALWKSTFDYAVRNDKKSWPYVKKLLLNPSTDIFLPEPANDTAKLAFATYKKRVNGKLDASVANDINAVALQVDDAVAWTRAFDVAAAADKLRWDYIKAVLTSKDKPNPDGKTDGKRQPTRQPQRGGTYRRPQVSYTDEQRKAAEERARRQLEEGEDD